MSALVSKLDSGQLTLLIFFIIIAVVVIIGIVASAIRDSITGRYEDCPQPELAEEPDVDE